MSGAGRLIIATLASLLLAGIGRTASFDPPLWAYPSTPQGCQPDPDDGKPKHLAGSARTYTCKPIAGQLTLQEMIAVAVYLGSKMP